jgi:hypothetical protein
MKNCGAIGVPRKSVSQVPCKSQPLPAYSPVGVVVLNVGSPVETKSTALAEESDRENMAARR